MAGINEGNIEYLVKNDVQGIVGGLLSALREEAHVQGGRHPSLTAPQLFDTSIRQLQGEVQHTMPYSGSPLAGREHHHQPSPHLARSPDVDHDDDAHASQQEPSYLEGLGDDYPPVGTPTFGGLHQRQTGFGFSQQGTPPPNNGFGGPDRQVGGARQQAPGDSNFYLQHQHSTAEGQGLTGLAPKREASLASPFQVSQPAADREREEALLRSSAAIALSPTGDEPDTVVMPDGREVAVPGSSPFPAAGMNSDNYPHPRAEYMQEAPEGVVQQSDRARRIHALNQQFQAVLSASPETAAALLKRQAVIDSIMHGFHSEILDTARTILEQHTWEGQPRQHSPVPGDPHTYLCDGVMYRIITTPNNINMLGGRDNALKMLHNERRALSALVGSCVARLHVPLSSWVEHLGEGLWVSVQLPLVEECLVYGSLDGGTTVVKRSSEMAATMKQACEVLNLKGHYAGADPANRRYTYGPCDAQGYHSITDGRYYILSMSRLMPTAPPSFLMHSEAGQNASLFEQLRPEAVQASAKPLSSDAYSAFADSPQEERDVSEIARYVFGEACAEMAEDLTALPIEGGVLLLQGSALIHMAHQRGINTRSLGRVLNSLPPRSKIAQVVKIEMAARAFRSLLREAFNDADGPPIKDESHCEMVAMRLFHCLLGVGGIGGTIDPLAGPADGGGSDIHQFWAVKLCPRILMKFGEVTRLAEFHIDLIDRPELFRRARELTNVAFSMETPETFQEFAEYVGQFPQTGLVSTEPISLRPTAKGIRCELAEPMQLCANGRIEEAKEMVDSTLVQVEGVLGHTSLALIPRLARAAFVDSLMGPHLYPEAQLERVLVLRKGDEGEQDLCYVATLLELSRMHAKRSKFEHALASLQEALEACDQVFGNEHPMVAHILNHMGVVFSCLDRWGSCQDALRHALHLREECYGKNHPVVGESLVMMASLYSHHHLHQEAKTMAKRAVDIFYAVYRSDQQPDVGRAKYHLGVSEYHLGETTAARIHLRESLEVMEQGYDIDTALCNSCTMYLEKIAEGSRTPRAGASQDGRNIYLQGDFQDTGKPSSGGNQGANPKSAPVAPSPLPAPSSSVHQPNAGGGNGGRGAGMGKGVGGGGTPMEKVHELLALHRYQEALPLQEAYVQEQRGVLGADSPEYATLLLQLGQTYQQAYGARRPEGSRPPSASTSANASKAMGAFQQAALIREDHYGPAHPYVAEALMPLATAQAAAGDYIGATAVLDRVVPIYELSHSNNPMALSDCLAQAARVHESCRSLDQALMLWQRVRELRQSPPTPSNTPGGPNMSSLGVAEADSEMERLVAGMAQQRSRVAAGDRML